MLLEGLLLASLVTNFCSKLKYYNQYQMSFLSFSPSNTMRLKNGEMLPWYKNRQNLVLWLNVQPKCIHIFDSRIIKIAK